MKANILIIGSIADRNLIRLVNSIKKFDTDSKICIDILHINPPNHNKLNYRISELTENIGEIYYVKDQKKYKLVYLNKFLRLVKIFSTLKDVKNNHYDLINIHYMSGFYYFIWHLIKRKGRKILITPWGSDIYRIKKFARFLIGRCYNKSNYISCGNIKMKYDIKTTFHVPENKIVDLAFGSQMIDLISESININRSISKKNLGLDDKYLIVCGYNASAAQQHLEIINSLYKVKSFLPLKTTLLFPMTYAKNVDYVKKVKTVLGKTDFDYVIYDEYLSDDQLLHIRKAADLFINIQLTDAFSASLQEYILCEAKIINGAWLSYPQLEKFGYPYYITKTVSTLSQTIKEVLKDQDGIIISENVKQFIRERGYKYQAKKWYDFYLNSSNS